MIGHVSQRRSIQGVILELLLLVRKSSGQVPSDDTVDKARPLIVLDALLLVVKGTRMLHYLV